MTWRALPLPALAAAADSPALKTVPNVPIVTTGTYHLAGNPYGNETTFTADDLADAVASVDDPAVALPRLKLGHESKWGDAEPAFGKVDNLRLGDEGQTIYGDFVGVPAWLADILPAVYPSRSIEAFFGVETPTGRHYQMVITAVALLGVQLPGVATLEDLAGLYAEELPEGVEIEARDKVVTASVGGDEMKIRGRKAKSSIALEDIRRAYYEDLSGDQAWWWIRAVYLDPNELIVDDDEGGLYRVPFEVKGEAVEFGDPVEVKIQYVNAGAEDKEPLVAEGAKAVYASRSESRPEATAEGGDMDPKLIREKLGLPEDTSDDDVFVALDKAKAEAEPTPEPEGDPAETEEDGGDEGGTSTETTVETEDTETTVKTEEEPAGVASNSDGTVTMDEAAAAQLREQAKQGAQAFARQQEQEREAFLKAAVDKGKFPPSRLDHWRKSFAADPEGTRQVIEGMPEGLIPVAEAGAAPGDDTNTNDAYDQSWLSPRERAVANGETPVGAGTVTREEV